MASNTAARLLRDNRRGGRNLPAQKTLAGLANAQNAAHSAIVLSLKEAIQGTRQDKRAITDAKAGLAPQNVPYRAPDNRVGGTSEAPGR